MKLFSAGSILCCSVLFVAAAGCGSSGSTGGTGGSGTGGARSGGSSGSSGGATGSGGASSTGGMTGSGGDSGTGGSTATGGSTGSGGNTGSGGAVSTGGTTGSGGGGVATGGSTGTAGTTGSGGATASGGAGGSSTGGSSAGGTSGSGGRSGGTGGTAGSAGGSSGTAHAMMNFFVTSDMRPTANFGGLAASDMRCQTLAAAVGHGSKTWKAYLSIATPPTNAIDRIGAGPYFNSQGTMLAADKAALHERSGDPNLFLTEKGEKVNGQWAGSPTPNQHDILTGTQRNGTLATGQTCGDWMSTTGAGMAGHSDGLGPAPNQTTPIERTYWNASHASNGNCGMTQNGGGGGKIYCFVAP